VGVIAVHVLALRIERRSESDMSEAARAG